MNLNRFSTILRTFVRTSNVRLNVLEQSLKRTLNPGRVGKGFCSVSEIRALPLLGPKCQLYFHNQNNLITKRFKQKRRPNNTKGEDDEDDEEDEEENENPMLMEDLNSIDSEGCQQLDIVVGTLRLDGFSKNAFSMTRAKVEESFYKGDIYVNGEKPPKKSYDLSQGDEIDIVKQPNIEDPNMVDIKRVQIVRIPDKTSDSGHMKVKINRWLDLTIKPHGRMGED